jgi:hypothetical protein
VTPEWYRFGYTGGSLVTDSNDKEVPRSIRFPLKIWKALDKDAKACGRSSVKQLEQLLRIYYNLEATETDNEKLLSIELAPGGTLKVPEKSSRKGQNAA